MSTILSDQEINQLQMKANVMLGDPSEFHRIARIIEKAAIEADRKARGEPSTVNIHCVKLKSRKKMEATIPRERLGWWHDVCPGQSMVLRDASASDLARCYRKESDTRGPEHFFCELPETGSLVSKDAIENCRTYKVHAAAPEVK